MHIKRSSVLVAGKDLQHLETLDCSLQREGYEVHRAHDGLRALEQVIMRQPHLVILETNLPKIDGFEICAQVREFSTVPMILLAEQGQDSDRVRSLQLGADDALTKPFRMNELLARVRSVLRRFQMNNGMDICALRAIVTIGELTVDYGQGLVTMAGRQIHLSATEYRLLIILTRHLGQVVPQEVLLEQIWGEHSREETNLLQVTINRLRHKLEPDPRKPCYLRTKPGIGYLLCSPHENAISL
jgi:DNA-binding response OmpR family regulator